MTMSVIWAFIMISSFIWGVCSGNFNAIGTAAMDGASEAVKLCIGICGSICLWCGIMEIMERAGVTKLIARALSPLLKKLFPSAEKDGALLSALSGNVAANFLGLGNAATPLGIEAVGRMARGDRATDEMCRLIVMNTASIQLIPTTVAAIRAAAGSETPFDILPPVWAASVCSVTVGILAAKLMSRRRKWQK